MKHFLAWLGSLLCAIGLHKWRLTGRWAVTRRLDGSGRGTHKLPVMRQCRRCLYTQYPDFYGSGVEDFEWGEKKDRFPPGIVWAEEEKDT